MLSVGLFPTNQHAEIKVGSKQFHIMVLYYFYVPKKMSLYTFVFTFFLWNIKLFDTNWEKERV